MRWNVHVLYDRGKRVPDGRTFQGALICLRHDPPQLLAIGPDDSLVFQLDSPRLTGWCGHDSIYFDGTERADGVLYGQSIMLQPVGVEE